MAMVIALTASIGFFSVATLQPDKEEGQMWRMEVCGTQTAVIFMAKCLNIGIEFEEPAHFYLPKLQNGDWSTHPSPFCAFAAFTMQETWCTLEGFTTHPVDAPKGMLVPKCSGIPLVP